MEFYTIRILVDDFDRMWRFYRDQLGLVPVAGHGSAPYGEFEWGGEARLALFDRRSMGQALGSPVGRPEGNGLGRAVVIFRVPDVDAVASRLRRRGVELLVGPVDRKEWGIRTIHLRDPEGNLVEICHWLSAV